MADRKDNAASDADAAPDASEANAASNSQSLNGTPQAASEASADASGADAKSHGTFLPVVAELITPADAREGFNRAAAEESAWRWQWPGYPTMAAMIALAAVVGALAGAATTAGLLRGDQSSTAVATNQALQHSVEKFGAELAALKAGLSDTQRDAHAQLGKFAARLDHAEKAQSAQAAKIAKASPEIVTGSIPIPVAKPATQLAVAEGWRLRDFYAGRAVVEESQSGRLFEVAPGSNLPGLGYRPGGGGGGARQSRATTAGWWW
jgi:hypothetical protein